VRNLRIAYSRGSGPLSWVIRYLTGSPVNHALFLVEESGVELVVGADWNGLVVQTRARWEARGNVVLAVPPLARPLDDGIPALLGMLDEPYDYGGLLGMPVVLLGRRLHRSWRNRLHSPRALFCSEAAATLLRDVGYPGAEQLDPSVVDPGYLMRWQLGGQS